MTEQAGVSQEVSRKLEQLSKNAVISDVPGIMVETIPGAETLHFGIVYSLIEKQGGSGATGSMSANRQPIDEYNVLDIPGDMKVFGGIQGRTINPNQVYLYIGVPLNGPDGEPGDKDVASIISPDNEVWVVTTERGTQEEGRPWNEFTYTWSTTHERLGTVVEAPNIKLKKGQSGGLSKKAESQLGEFREQLGKAIEVQVKRHNGR